MKRILVDALSARSGGGWTYLVNVLREIERDDRGLAFTVLVDREHAARLGSVRGVDIEAVRLPSTPLRVAWEEVVLPFRSRRFDLLYALADLSPVFSSIPTVAALRNLNIYDRRYYDTARLRWLHRLTKAGLPRVDRVVFPSRAAADWIGPHLGLPPERIDVVHHGISAEDFAAAASSAEDDASATRPEERYLLLPAAVERHKNIVCAVEAVSRFADPELSLWIAGGTHTDPEYVERVRAAAERTGVSGRVRLLGAVDYGRIASLYRHAEAMVFPSVLETFGHPLLEAMLSELPIVASDLPVFEEIAGGVAWFFPRDDAAALAAAVDAMQADPEERRRRAERGLARVATFSWKASVDALCDVFGRVLAARAH